MTAEPAEADAGWSAAAYAENARFVSDLGADALALLDPRPGERILDLGCGDGALTRRLIATGAQIVGVDASADMARAARAAGVDAVEGRGEALGAALADRPPFDAVFSNAAMHWMPRQQDVIDGVAAALRPGGRFVAELGGHGNVAALRVALIAALASEAGVDDDLSSIWIFPTVAAQRARLEQAGFAVEQIALIPRPTPLPGDVGRWFDTLAAPALALAPEPARAAVRARAAALAAAALRDEAGRWTADYMRLRFRARLERAS